ncbi:hypothetical protein BELL_0385g00050 [Botrytis elliptica]|uniref:Uncharacterized protein n=1 Tax=Botrytis elliptica TaxID=278938 RepID=A0A4Z1JIK2_9HELO|nr:hypothetical protein BELL_0385g00050 [Botrytis elliptica]
MYRADMQISFRQKTDFSESAYHRSEDDLFAKTFGIKDDGYYDDEGFGLNSCDGRSVIELVQCVAIQIRTVYEKQSYRTEKCEIHQTYNRICSTQNVPPQRHNWWANEVFGKENLGRKLPAELLNMIDKDVDEWPIGRDEAKEDRDNLLG